MPLFDYTASDREGALSHGQLEANDRASASRVLAQKGLFVLGVTPAARLALAPEPEPAPVPPAKPAEPWQDLPEKHPLRAKLEAEEIEDEATVAVATVYPTAEPRSWLPQRSWSRMDRALYLRQFQVMFSAGIPLYRSAAVLADGADFDPRTNEKLKEIPLDLERGRTLSKALLKSTLFTHLIVSSVRLGEESGQLDDILDALSTTEEQAVGLRRALVSRLTYPAVVLVAMSLGLLVLGHVMSRVMASLPAFQKSAPTIVTVITSLYRNSAFLPLLFLLMGALGYSAYRLWKNPEIRVMVEREMLRIPLLGALIRRVEATSVTSQLALLIRAGLPLDRGLGLCASSVRTLVFRLALLQTQVDIRNGEDLTSSLKGADIFPEDVLALVQVGELSGSLSDSLDIASRYCVEQVERTLEAALSIIEPLLIGLMGIAVGTVLLVTFVPIFNSLKDL